MDVKVMEGKRPHVIWIILAGFILILPGLNYL